MLFLTYSVFIGAEVRYLFIFISHLYNHEVPTKHPREKIWTHENIHEKKILDSRNNPQVKIWTHGIHTRNNRDPRNTYEKKF